MTGLEPTRASVSTVFAVLRSLQATLAKRPDTWAERAVLIEARDGCIVELAGRGQPALVIMARGRVAGREVRLALAGTRFTPWGAR